MFFVHDAIPLEYPEYCKPGASMRHQRRLEVVSEIASLVVTNSTASAQSISAFWREQRRRAPEIEVIPLGVSDAFLIPRSTNPPRPSPSPYFICVGTIEARKNLAFLLAVWARVVQRLGDRSPRLVLVGRRGWENENVIDILDRSRVIAPFVAEVADMTDDGIAELMQSAVAVLAPSFAEGFGLPVAEALATGAPAIVSDIPAHREVGGDYADYIDPIDGRAWVEAILNYCAAESPRRAEAVTRIRAYRAMTWEAHVARVLDVASRA